MSLWATSSFRPEGDASTVDGASIRANNALSGSAAGGSSSTSSGGGNGEGGATDGGCRVGYGGAADCSSTQWIVLDFTGVVGVDATAARVCFLMLKHLLRASGVTLVFAGLRPKIRALLQAHAVVQPGADACFVRLDDALEWCEEQLLGRVLVAAAAASVTAAASPPAAAIMAGTAAAEGAGGTAVAGGGGGNGGRSGGGGGGGGGTGAAAMTGAAPAAREMVAAGKGGIGGRGAAAAADSTSRTGGGDGGSVETNGGGGSSGDGASVSGSSSRSSPTAGDDAGGDGLLRHPSYYNKVTKLRLHAPPLPRALAPTMPAREASPAGLAAVQAAVSGTIPLAPPRPASGVVLGSAVSVPATTGMGTLRAILEDYLELEHYRLSEHLKGVLEGAVAFFVEEAVPEGTVLFSERDASTKLYFIARGAVELRKLRLVSVETAIAAGLRGSGTRGRGASSSGGEGTLRHRGGSRTAASGCAAAAGGGRHALAAPRPASRAASRPVLLTASRAVSASGSAEEEAEEEPRLAKVSAGGSFGELGFFLKRPQPFRAVATEDCALYTLERRAMARMQAENPELCILVQKAVLKSLCLAAAFSIEAQHYGPT
ncbi:unnamed protein product [Phaeothamnion confervicola]